MFPSLLPVFLLLFVFVGCVYGLGNPIFIFQIQISALPVAGVFKQSSTGRFKLADKPKKEKKAKKPKAKKATKAKKAKAPKV